MKPVFKNAASEKEQKQLNALKFLYCVDNLLLLIIILCSFNQKHYFQLIDQTKLQMIFRCT